MKITIAHLYPDLLNIYSDMGNIICLSKRLSWRGIEVKVIPVGMKDKFQGENFDLLFSGGGQDRQQAIVTGDLQAKKKDIVKAIEEGMPALVTCGSFQLFGHWFKTAAGVKIPGISIFDAYTTASSKRKIGNIVIKSSLLTTGLVGFENHSGNTFIKNSPLGIVIKGFGNNGADGTEGAIYKNCIGTYLHGPVLPKNPHLADWLLEKALTRKYGQKIKLEPLDDDLELEAHQQAVKRTLSG